MTPEVKLVLESEFAVHLDEVTRRTQKKKGTVHQNLKTAVRNGVLYQPKRGWYQKVRTDESLYFFKPINEYVARYLESRDPSELVQISHTLQRQAEHIQKFLAGIATHTIGADQVHPMDEWLIPMARKKRRKKSEDTQD